jgi:hypothetical protein
MYCVPEMRMSNVQAKLASAFLLSVAASVALPMMDLGSAAHAADSCITEPKADTPQGKHWYYRIERGTARHCWYLRGDDEASARTPVAAAKPALQTSGSAPATRSLADARAEFAPKARGEDNAGAPPSPSVWPDPQGSIPAGAAPAAATTGIGPGAGAPDSQLASRWPQASGTPSTAKAAPQASLLVADAQPTDAAAETSAAEPPQASPPPAREVGSLQKLAVVVFGALALAGLSGSLVYRLAGARSRRRRHEQRWPQRQAASLSLADEARGAPWVAPESSPTVPQEDFAMDRDDLNDVQDNNETRLQKNEDSFEKIEDFLTRLTRQLQDELQNTRSTELENPRPQ